jgi:hypothetical protein
MTTDAGTLVSHPPMSFASSSSEPALVMALEDAPGCGYRLVVGAPMAVATDTAADVTAPCRLNNAGLWGVPLLLPEAAPSLPLPLLLMRMDSRVDKLSRTDGAERERETNKQQDKVMGGKHLGDREGSARSASIRQHSDQTYGAIEGKASKATYALPSCFFALGL